VIAVALGRVGNRDVIASGGDDRTVRIWDAHTGQPIGQPLTGHSGNVRAVALGRVGDRDVIISGGDTARCGSGTRIPASRSGNH
jgi:WD40 repeat protein